MNPLRLLQRLVRFLLSIRFGVVLLLFLMVVMMVATQFEASTSTRAMKRFIYGSAWFDTAVFLFVINIIVNTWRRRPFKFRHAGFLTVHLGVLIIVTGGLCTRYFGIDGTMPIPEGSESRRILLPDSDLVVETAAGTKRYTTDYELAPWQQERDDLFAVPGTDYMLHVNRYFPTGAVVDTLRNDAESVNPVARIAVSTSGHEPEAGWLALADPGPRSFGHANVAVHFVESADSLRAVWSGNRQKGAPETAGELTIVWADGAREAIAVPLVENARIPTSRPGRSVQVVQVFRAFTLTETGAADGVGQPENPAIRFRLLKGQDFEQHFSFTNFPDFRVDPPEGEEWELSHADWRPSREALRESGAREIAIVRAGPERFVTYTSWGDPLDGAPLELAQTRAFESRPVQLSILDYAERGRLSKTVHNVSDEVRRPVLHLTVVKPEEGAPVRLASVIDLLRGRRHTEPAPFDPNRVWLFHGESYEFPAPDGTIRVHYNGQSVPLDFGIHLIDFREETYPGISLAASYESHVIVRPEGAEEFPHEIYMNHPLKYAGYTFYQASFQRTPEGEVTVLSVARDPGMKISFFGYVVLSLGLVLIFFAKSWFIKLDERIARSRRALRTEGASS